MSDSVERYILLLNRVKQFASFIVLKYVKNLNLNCDVFLHVKREKVSEHKDVLNFNCDIIFHVKRDNGLEHSSINMVSNFYYFLNESMI